MTNMVKTAFMWMWPVKGSSNVRSVGYDRKREELGIRFKSSPQRYIYSDVPINVYKELIAAPSRGKYVHQNIKGVYPYRRKDYTGDDFAGEDIMPSTSQKQQRYFGWLYSKKKSGDTSGLSERDKRTLDSMSKDQIRDFAATKRKGLPVTISKAAGIVDALKELGRSDIVRHIGGGALIGAPIGAAWHGAMGSEFKSTKDRLIDGAMRGVIGGSALGAGYHLGRKYYNMPRFRDLVGNRVPRY